MEQQFRMVTFYDEYMKQRAKGRTDVEASDLADSAIRERHGAISAGDLPALMANKNEAMKMLTLFMGYFTTQRNWMRQLPHQARQGDFSGMMKTIYGTIAIAAFMNYAIFTKQKKDESAFAHLARSVATVPMAMIPYIRGGWSYYSEGYKQTDPFVNMAAAVGQLGKDGWDWLHGRRVKNPVKHAAQSIGIVAGVPGAVQMGRTGEFFYDLKTGQQHPRDIVEFMRGVLTGESKRRK
jgi:hypothetical protein